MENAIADMPTSLSLGQGDLALNHVECWQDSGSIFYSHDTYFQIW